ncbi:MAG: DegT/DnrJ/EryC1/StrS family aminotransferase [Thermovirgaceae bacterium]|nr:DegT/DnrJ/EryC1/StrS family aminotransferase [Thermovirgaceae bacterium]
MADPVLPSFDLSRNWKRVRKETLEAIVKVLDSQHFILGPEVDALEKDIASYLRVSHAAGCASGTDALLLALMALGVGPGDEVITTPYSFFATVSCITRVGATPVFADVDPDTYNISPINILDKLTAKTKAVIPVHLFGQMVQVEEFSEAISRRGAFLVEDCAQAIGATRVINGRVERAGALGDIGCFSFFPTKNLGGFGDGGLISTNSDALSVRIRSLRVHGSGKQYFHDEVGLNSRLDEIQAAILRVRLRHLETWNEERRLVDERYRTLFAEMNLGEWITPPAEAEGNRHVFHQYVIRCSHRDKLKTWLAERGITARVYYPLSLHLQPCFSFLGYKEGEFPVSESLSQKTLALPIFPELLPEEQERVAAAILEFYKNGIFDHS